MDESWSTAGGRLTWALRRWHSRQGGAFSRPGTEEPSVAAIAEHHRLKNSTLAMHMAAGSDSDVQRNPKLDHVLRYANAFGVSPRFLLMESDNPDEPGEFGVSVTRPTAETGDSAELEWGIPVTGDLAAGVWIEAEDSFVPYELRAPSDPRYPPHAQFGLLVRDTHCNRIVRVGEIVICLKLSLHPIELVDGHALLIERFKPDGTKALTARRVRRAAGSTTMELVMDTDDRRYTTPGNPRYQAPVHMSADSREIMVDGMRIHICALIIGAHRRDP